jgi:hypothetical protein
MHDTEIIVKKLLELSEIVSLSLTRMHSSIPINRLVKFNRSCLHSWGCIWQAGGYKTETK